METERHLDTAEANWVRVSVNTWRHTDDPAVISNDAGATWRNIFDHGPEVERHHPGWIAPGDRIRSRRTGRPVGVVAFVTPVGALVARNGIWSGHLWADVTGHHR